jgi:KinB signaling pathway activation protein
MLSDHAFISGLTPGGYIFNGVNMFGVGLMYSVFAQMGFFAYLMLNYIALSIFRRMELWKVLQVILTVIVLIDLVALPLIQFSHPKAWYIYATVPALLLVGAWVVGYFKVKATNASAWIPTLFFMIVVTSIEAVPAFKIDHVKDIVQMLIPLFACNAWQILKLHQLVRKAN